MRIVLLIFILLFSSSSFAISLEDGLRIIIKNNHKKTPNEIFSEYSQLYLDALKYKELLELSTHIANKNKNILTEAKVKASVDSSKNSALEKLNKIYFISNNKQMIDKINYKISRQKLENLLHVKVESVKLPLIPKVPYNKEKTLLLALKSQGLNEERDNDSLFREKIESIKKDVTKLWKNYKLTQKNLATTSNKREYIKNNYLFRVASYNILATDYSFLNSILNNKYSFKEKSHSNAIELFYNNKAQKQFNKKHKNNTNCFKVISYMLNVREKPSYSKGKILHRYKKGEVVCAIAQNLNWIKTKHGWCFKKYLLSTNIK